MSTPLTDVINRLKETRERDRKNAAETFAAAANLVNIADNSLLTATRLIEEFTPGKEIIEGKKDLDIRDQLHEKWQKLRSEADQLLIQCVSDEDMSRALLYEQILDRIKLRIQSLSDKELMGDKKSEYARTATKDIDFDYLQSLSKSQLMELAKSVDLKGYSKLNKDGLIDLIDKRISEMQK